MSDAELIKRALEVRKNAYAPYSKYEVGAAVLADGKVFAGCNVENASLGAGICAERSAVLQAVAAGARNLEAVAIVTKNSPPVAPCGICRQVLNEFSKAKELRIILANPQGETRTFTLADLLPERFGPNDL